MLQRKHFNTYACFLFFCLCFGRVTPACVTLEDVDQTFTSPNYPSNYPDYLSQTWTLSVDPSQTLVFQFDHFAFEESSYNYYDPYYGGRYDPSYGSHYDPYYGGRYDPSYGSYYDPYYGGYYAGGMPSYSSSYYAGGMPSYSSSYYGGGGSCVDDGVRITESCTGLTLWEDCGYHYYLPEITSRCSEISVYIYTDGSGTESGLSMRYWGDPPMPSVIPVSSARFLLDTTAVEAVEECTVPARGLMVCALQCAQLRCLSFTYDSANHQCHLFSDANGMFDVDYVIERS